MPLVVTCDACNKRLKAPERLAGKRVRCKCGAPMTVPSPAPATLDLVEPEAMDLSLLAEGHAVGGTQCPGCGAELAEGAALCVGCGFNRKTGQRMHVQVDSGEPVKSAATEPEETAAKGRRKKPRADKEPSAALAIVLKMVIWIAVLGGLGAFAWYIKGAISFDPKQQMVDAEAKLYPGMTVEQVVTAMEGKKPREVQCWEDQPTNLGGVTIMMAKPRNLPYVDDFMENSDPKLIKYGFVFVYRYTTRNFLNVLFTSEGKVDRVDTQDILAPLGI